jgi:hypothetical protein
MPNLIQRYSLCAFETIAPGDVVVRCDRPCMGMYCLEHAQKIRDVEELEVEVDRIVRGRTKK